MLGDLVARRRRKQKKPTARSGSERGVSVEVQRFELARGHDHLLRGSPEPTLILAPYREMGGEVALVERKLLRLRSSGEYPERIECEGAELKVSVPRREEMTIVLLGLALEEDDGRGVQRVYGELEEPGAISVWAEATEPDPMSLSLWMRTVPPRAPTTCRVHVLDAHGDLRDQRGDDWIGGAICHIDPTVRAEERRMRFLSTDDRNDWTAVLRVRTTG